MQETRAEIDQTRQECVDFMKQLKEDEKRQKAAEQEQSVKLMIDAQAASELENIKEKYNRVLKLNQHIHELFKKKANEIKQSTFLNKKESSSKN